MGKIGIMVARSMDSDKRDSKDEYDSKEDDSKDESDVSEAKKLAMYEFREAFNSGDIGDAAEAFQKLCDIFSDY